ncbi:MAG: TrkA C-terminal domain-containing protein [Oscillospiraceae bacterium]|jgi:trk system potassium uptake protein TrkA
MLSKSHIRLMSFSVPEGSALTGEPLEEAAKKLPDSVLICIVERGNEIIIPKGDFSIEKGDIITAICAEGEEAKFFSAIGQPLPKIRNCMLVGGGEITYYLVKMLLDWDIDVKIIEQDRARCEELNMAFPDAMVINGDGTSRVLLDEENINTTDALVACTGIDEVNMILGLYAKNKVKTKVITKVNHVDFGEIVNGLSLGSVINPKALTTQRILQYVRAAKNSLSSNVESLYRMCNGRVEVLEFLISDGAELCGIPLKDMRIRQDVLVAGILRHEKMIIPNGQSMFQQGDTVIVFTTAAGFGDLHDIIAGE